MEEALIIVLIILIYVIVVLIAIIIDLKDERMVLRGFRKLGARLQPDREGTAGEPGR